MSRTMIKISFQKKFHLSEVKHWKYGSPIGFWTGLNCKFLWTICMSCQVRWQIFCADLKQNFRDGSHIW